MGVKFLTSNQHTMYACTMSLDGSPKGKTYAPKFFVIHYISMHFAWCRSAFLRVLKSLQIKEGEPILYNVWIIWSHLPYFSFKSFIDPNSSSLIRFQCILHDSRVLFSESWNFYKLKRRDLISGWNQFCRKSELFGPPFCISILKVLWSRILCH